MPDTIRRSGGFARPWLGGFALAIAVGFPVCVRAEEPPRLALHELVLGASHSIGSHEVAALALLVGLLLFSVVTANMLLRARARWARLERSAQENNAALRAELDRANALLASEPQVIVDWPAASDEPSIEGDPAIVGVAALDQVLAFGAWLEPAKAGAMERSIELLRARGEAFSMAFTTLGGRPIEVQGAPLPAAQCSASKTPAASSANSSILPSGIRRCAAKSHRCARWSRSCHRRCGFVTPPGGSLS
jgi:hypothetical protein